MMSEVDRGSQLLLNVKRYAVLLALFWTVLIGCLIGWNVWHEYNEARKLVRNEAQAHFLKDRTIRYWAATHGGVYVPPTEKTPPNPHLNAAYETLWGFPASRTVKDNGKGVAENHQDRIFEFFHRLNPSDDIADEGFNV